VNEQAGGARMHGCGLERPKDMPALAAGSVLRLNEDLSDN
jgi:hypothetical protein